MNENTDISGGLSVHDFSAFSYNWSSNSRNSLTNAWVLPKVFLQSVLERIMSCARRCALEGGPHSLTALVEPLVSVDSLVSDKVRLLAESFATLNTVIGLLSRVFPHVKREGRDLREGLPALAAVERLLARVPSDVDGEGRALGEGFPTLVAFVGLLPGMASHMHDEGRSLREGLSALVTYVGLLAGVASHVEVEQ